MKYIILVGDGMADYPLEELDGRTPLEIARTPNMDKVVKLGRGGMVRTVPKGMQPGSDIANLSILGYDPHKYYTGRAVLEAVNIGVKIAKDEIAFRCNLVTVSDGKMADYSAGHIRQKESALLIAYLQEKLGSEAVRFYPGVSYRNLLVINKDHFHPGGGTPGVEVDIPRMKKIKCVAPHDIIGESIAKYMPKGRGAALLADLMERSALILKEHPINKVRVDLEENPANMIWLWGQGTAVDMPSFKELFGKEGAIVSAVDLLKGIGKSIGFEVIDVPGATGYYDTDYEAKARYGLEALKRKDLIFVHIEAPDEAGHNGDLPQKIKAIERFDKFVVGRFVEEFAENKAADFRLLVLPDHRTPISVRTHTPEPVCFAICGTGIEPDKTEHFNEKEAELSGWKFEKGEELMDFFIDLA